MIEIVFMGGDSIRVYPETVFIAKTLYECLNVPKGKVAINWTSVAYVRQLTEKEMEEQ